MFLDRASLRLLLRSPPTPTWCIKNIIIIIIIIVVFVFVVVVVVVMISSPSSVDSKTRDLTPQSSFCKCSLPLQLNHNEKQKPRSLDQIWDLKAFLTQNTYIIHMTSSQNIHLINPNHSMSPISLNSQTLRRMVHGKCS